VSAKYDMAARKRRSTKGVTGKRGSGKREPPLYVAPSSFATMPS